MSDNIILWVPHQFFGPPIDESDGPFVKVTVLPSAEPGKQLDWLWRQWRQCMLVERGKTEPFQDLQRPIDSMKGMEIELAPWRPEYESLRTQVEAL